MLQRKRFPQEIKLLVITGEAIPSETTITARTPTKFDDLNPFLNEGNFIRVNGRLKNSDLMHNKKHPLLRQRPKVMQAQMAVLPERRVAEARAFSRTEVDFFGLILIKEEKHSNRILLKTSGCVFICLVSKAAHIELFTDLSTEGFLSALRRFIDRRGVTDHAYSDNVPDNSLATYNLITKARQDFLKIWHKEYLSELQTHQKWQNFTSELKVRSVVLLMENNLGCASWPLGVIAEVFSGSDDIVNVASLKTTNGTYKRNITRLGLLPTAGC
ncbi:uncharacterized protein LOC117171120 [Belonocnema kinseyi]|uniref:uncharacterized protein LOC117171120 n=1 Tax=Belonocnema kinseyi TaxID=2817044 RepID=UPI00143D0725|nr:uncharacterized protein LOC117171120 [Belonocnema kinseyi]